MISVIIPIYNTEKYLKNCIDSVLKSSYQDFELLLVDDGSTDGSNSVCCEYAQNDSRIRVLTQQNGGVSNARNYGIQESRGEWIVFLDSDDKISKNFFEIIHEYGDKAQLLFFDFAYSAGQTVKNEKVEIKENIVDERIRIDLIEKCIRMKQLVSGGNTNLRSPWAKAYRREIIIENHICFPEIISMGEDELFNLAYFQYITKYVYIQIPVYVVTVRDNSLSHKYRPSLLEEDYLFQTMLRNYLDSTGSMDYLKKTCIDNVLASMVYVLKNSIFHRENRCTFKQKCQKCQMMRNYDIYAEALKYSHKYGSYKRRILLSFYQLKLYGILQFIFMLFQKGENLV